MMAPRPKADVQGSTRGKLGIAWDRVMIYGTGGVAFGGFNTNFSLASAGGVTAAGIVVPPPSPTAAFRPLARVGRRAAASNMPLPTIGGYLVNTASRTSALSGMGLSQAYHPARSSTPTAICRKTRCRAASATNSTLMRQPLSSPNIDSVSSGGVDAKKPGLAAGFLR